MFINNWYTCLCLIIIIVIIIYCFYSETENFSSEVLVGQNICEVFNKTLEGTRFLDIVEEDIVVGDETRTVNSLKTIDGKYLNYKITNNLTDNQNFSYSCKLFSISNIPTINDHTNSNQPNPNLFVSYESNMFKILPNALKCLDEPSVTILKGNSNLDYLIDLPQCYTNKQIPSNSCECRQIFGDLSLSFNSSTPELLYYPKTQSFNWIDSITRNDNYVRTSNNNIDGQIDLIDFRKIVFNKRNDEIEIGHRLPSLTKITMNGTPTNNFNHELHLVIPKDCFIVLYAHTRTMTYKNHDGDDAEELTEVEFLSRDQVHLLEDEMAGNQNLRYGTNIDITQSTEPYVSRDNTNPTPILARIKVGTEEGQDLTDRKFHKVRYDKFIPYVVNFSFLQSYANFKKDPDNNLHHNILSKFGTFRPDHLHVNTSGANDVVFGQPTQASTVFGKDQLLHTINPIPSPNADGDIEVTGDELSETSKFKVMTLRELEKLMGGFPINNNFMVPMEGETAPLNRYNDPINDPSFRSHILSDRITGIKIYEITPKIDYDPSKQDEINDEVCQSNDSGNTSAPGPAEGNDVGLPPGSLAEAAYTGGVDGTVNWLSSFF